MNRLANQASSYLRRHVEDPVDWYPWGAEAWARAVAEDKPVLVSIGEANSHWCQVMGRESYADATIAEPLNRSFVCVLVDRAERPDLDALYLEALQALTGGGGWPMTLFLTPERRLFFGGTYFPPTARDDLPSFRSVIESVAEEWQDSRRSLEQQAAEVVRQIEGRDAGLPPRGDVGRDLLEAGIRAVVASVDQVHGGFGEAPRFPQPWLVELLLRAAARGPGGGHGAADLTLRRMARGGIYDQIGGGFHHSTGDPAWAVPHYEKLLCDNAGLLRLYTHAWQARHDPLFGRIATECAEYLLTRLRDPSGAFIAGEGAESRGVDGAAYRWTRAALAQVSAGAAAFYGLALTGDDAGALTASGDVPPPEVRAALAAARAGRERPEPDTMVITSWNGQAIAALADAGAALDRPDLVAAAEEAAAFLLANVATNDRGLCHTWHDGTANGDGLLEDYAYLAEGLLALWEATFDARWARAAEELVRRMLEQFWDADGGGLWSTPRHGEHLVVARKDLVDATTPSPNGVASLVLQRLGVLLGDEALARLGVEILEAAEPLMQAFPQECGTLLAALDFHLSVTREIAVVGDQASPDTVALLREVRTRFLPNRVLAGGTGLASPLLEGREPIDGRATAYVCEHNVCKRPTTDPAELARQLRMSGTPAPETVNRAAELARFTLHRMTLLDRLDNPLWIDPLLERGFFATPPAPIDSYVPGALGAPPWPDSKYLAKMAGVDPFAVHRVALAIPETANSLVHEDLAEAALALPPDLAADFAGRAEGWLAASPYHVMLPKKLGELVSHLAKKGRGDAAVRLAGALLELFADTEGVEQGRDPGPDGFVQAPQPRARYGAWDYEQVLKENVPDLVDAVRQPALVLACDLLDLALTLSLPPGTAPAGGADGSFLWRPAVEDDPRNVDRSLRNALVSAVRDAAERIARGRPGAVVEVAAELSRRPWAVFRRLALHVVRLVPADAPSLVTELLGERRLLTDPHTSREYVLLGRERWAELPAEVREQILGWVEEGPDLVLWDAVPERWATDPADRLGAEEYALAWSEVRRELLAEADTSLDEAFAFELNDPPVDLATPKQAAWMRSAGPQAVARFALAWREPGLIGAPTAGGLWRKLVEVVTTEPTGFAEGALELAPLPDDGLRAVAIGLREAAKQGTAFEWGPVVGLFAGTVARAGASPALLMAIARCLAAGFDHGDAEIPASLREQVWELLASLVGPGSDPAVAAEGLHAVLRYALWVRRRLEGSSGRASPSAPVGWDGMPEVRTALEALLGLNRDRTAVVQGVLGQWFPWLVMLDPEWAVRRRGDVFPAQPELEHLRRAAWETYLSVAPVYDQVFALLADEYGDAERDLSPDDPLTRPRQGLAEHLVALYLRGRLALDGDSLLTGFFERASPEQRAHALAWVGQMLQRQTDRTPTQILQRLEQLWERRVAVARAAPDPSMYAEELAQFGSWFVSGRFSSSWAVPRLLELLALTGRVTNTTKVVEALKEHMETMPWDVVQIVAILVANERDSITIIGWGQNAQQILSRIVGGSDARARDLALDLLDTFDLQPVAELVRWS